MLAFTSALDNAAYFTLLGFCNIHDLAGSDELPCRSVEQVEVCYRDS